MHFVASRAICNNLSVPSCYWYIPGHINAWYDYFYQLCNRPIGLQHPCRGTKLWRKFIFTAWLKRQTCIALFCLSKMRLSVWYLTRWMSTYISPCQTTWLILLAFYHVWLASSLWRIFGLHNRGFLPNFYSYCFSNVNYYGIQRSCNIWALDGLQHRK